MKIAFFLTFTSFVVRVYLQTESISIYEDKLYPREGETLSITCNILNFDKSATWMKPGQDTSTSCTNEKCTVKSTNYYQFRSDQKGIYLTIVAFSQGDETWICKYLTHSKTITINTGSFRWTKRPEKRVPVGESALINFEYVTEDIVSRVSLYKDNCTAGICESNLIATYWNGNRTTGIQYSEKMMISTNNNAVSVFLTSTSYDDTGNYTCVLLTKQRHQVTASLIIVESEDQCTRGYLAFILLPTAALIWVLVCYCKLKRRYRLKKREMLPTYVFVKDPET